MHYESEFKNEDSLKKTMYKVKRGKRCTILYSKNLEMAITDICGMIS